ncbi:MAG: protein-glutamate O-methyltransferase CheR [Planctomycetes bacterium]|nr:protein-glutamate O-methyltransferase CheR [Planctomycetota bacterium]
MRATEIFTAELVLTDRDYERFRQLIYQHSRINLTDKKKALMRARFGKVMREHNLTSFAEYYDYIINDKTGRAILEMTNAISTNLTSFFREKQHFDYLCQVYLPPLVKKYRTAHRNRIRAWSAGCSTGEEPYTLAMIMRENIPDPLGWDLKILATDIDSAVLDKAKEGLYSPKAVENVPAAWKQKYLTREGTRQEPQFRVSEKLKQLIAFRRLNLMTRPYPFNGPFDLIFCRNVMIYFDRDTQSELVNRFYQLLQPGGVLMIGHSESLTRLDHQFHYEQPTIYRR